MTRIPQEIFDSILQRHLARQLDDLAQEDLQQSPQEEEGFRARVKVIADAIRSLRETSRRESESFLARLARINQHINTLANQAEKALGLSVSSVLVAMSGALESGSIAWATMRVAELVGDTDLRSEALALLENADRLARTLGENFTQARRPMAELEESSRQLAARVERMLGTNLPEAHIPAQALHAARRLWDAGSAVVQAAGPDFRKAIVAATTIDPEAMTPSARWRAYEQASTAPLAAAAEAFLGEVRVAIPSDGFQTLGRLANHVVRSGPKHGEWIAKSPLAFLLQADLEQALGNTDRFLANLDTPTGRRSLDRALDVVRVACVVEKDNLERIAANVRKEDRPRVAQALSTYAAGIARLVMDAVAPIAPERQWPPVQEAIDALLKTATREVTAGLLTSDGDPMAMILGTTGAVGEALKSGIQAIDVKETANIAYEVLREAMDERFAGELDALNRALFEGLSVIRTAPGTEDAVLNVIADLAAVSRMIGNMIQLFGAVANPDMDDKARAKAIQRSVFRMGPLFLKKVQTAANLQHLYQRIRGSKGSPNLDDRWLRALPAFRKLQDEVEEMPFEQVQAEIDKSLGPNAFLSIDPIPVGSGSMGQVHKATIEVTKTFPWTGISYGKEVVDVRTKVLRPGLEEEMERTERVTRLAISIMREVVGLDLEGFERFTGVAKKVLPMLDRVHQSFVESFKVEADPLNEAANVKHFERLLAPHPNVIVPVIYDSHTNVYDHTAVGGGKGGVITMQAINGFKLSAWLDCYAFSCASAPLVEGEGVLAGFRRNLNAQEKESLREEAVDRASRWIETTIGLLPLSAEIFSERHGWFGVRVDCAAKDETAKPRGRMLDIYVRTRNGQIQPRFSLPEMDKDVVEARAKRWGERAYGRPCVSSIAKREKRGWRVELTLEGKAPEREPDPSADTATDGDPTADADEAMRKPPPLTTVRTFVRAKDAAFRPESVVPDLTSEGIGALRDRLVSLFLIQILMRLVHGDLHEGNLFVMRDGRKIGLIDFGLALELGLADAAGPAMLLAGAIAGNANTVARAMVGMSATYPSLNRRQREEAITQAEAVFKTRFEAIIDEGLEHVRDIPWVNAMKLPSASSLVLSDEQQAQTERSLVDYAYRTIDALYASMDAMMEEAGLTPSTTNLHLFKTSASMLGNIAAFEQVNAPRRLARPVLQALGEFTLYQCMRPLQLGRIVHYFKQRKVARMDRELAG